jgi:hypothetical protein
MVKPDVTVAPLLEAALGRPSEVAFQHLLKSALEGYEGPVPSGTGGTGLGTGPHQPQHCTEGRVGEVTGYGTNRLVTALFQTMSSPRCQARSSAHGDNQTVGLADAITNG